MIPTAAEILKRDCTSSKDNAINAMIEFAKMHVEAALKSASKNAMGVHCTDYVDPDLILNAYPLTNIK